MSNSATKPRAVLYCRVSSKEQEETGYSLDAQEKLLKEYSEKLGYMFKTGDVFRISESASGKQIRKKFEEMLRYINKNNIDIILCEKIDRLTRNLKDAAIIDEWVHEKINREVHFVKESFILNQNTKAHENFVWDMKVATARFYTNNLSEEVRKGQKEKIAQGQLPTKPPLGYKTIGEKGHKIHIIDEIAAPYIKQMFELYATGNYATTLLTDEINEKGFRTRLGYKLSRSKVHLILTDPFFYGDFRWKGQIYHGEHEPLISKDMWNKVQALLKEKNTGKKPARGHLLQGKVHCSYCEGLMTWYEQKGRVYGHCTYIGKSKNCEGKTCLREDAVEEQIMQIINDIAPVNEEVLGWIEEVIKKDNEERVTTREKEINAVTARLKAVREKKDKMFEAKVLEKVPMEYCDRKITEYHNEEKALEGELSKITDKDQLSLKLGIITHELACRALEIYKQFRPEQKKIMYRELFRDLIQNRHDISPNFSDAGDYLYTWMPIINKYYEQYKKMPDVKQFMDFSEALRSERAKNDKLAKMKLRTAKKSANKEKNTISGTKHRSLLPVYPLFRTPKMVSVSEKK